VLAPLAVSVADVPAQTEFELALMESAGAALTVIVVWEVAVQPLAAVPVTVYVWVAFGINETPLETPLFQA
jgi:hypothetical protein